MRSLLKGAVSRLPNSFCFLCPNAIHAPLFAMRLEKIPVNDKITASCQTKFVSQTSYQWLQTTKMNFEKLLGGQVFKNHNYNPFHSSSSFSIPTSHSICGVIYTFFKLFERLCISQFQLRPAHPPRLLRGICLPFQSRGWGICKFCYAREPCICQPRGYSRAFDTHAVSYQNITTQRVLLEKKQIGSSVKDRNKLKRVVKACSRFYACISSLLIKPELHSENRSYRCESTFFG